MLFNYTPVTIHVEKRGVKKTGDFLIAIRSSGGAPEAFHPAYIIYINHPGFIHTGLY